MLPFAYYLLKVLICSGILYGYYLLALRNKIFHRWNRFYLLAAIVLSLAAPLIKINIWQNADEPITAIQLLQVVSTGDEIVFEYAKNSRGIQIDASNLSFFIYTIVSLILLSFLIQTLVKINRLKKNNRLTIVEDVNFINTDADGTPFSFFNNIFWNDKIDINSATGKQIFQHEVAHVQEKHSYDKIFTNIVLIFFWCNPFFWLIRKELNIIHEFIADKKALEDSDTAAFAAMILQATYPHQQFNITNNFFYSSLKRRLAMLTKNKNPKISYVSRLLALPLAALVFLAFTLKVKNINNITPTEIITATSTIENNTASQNVEMTKNEHGKIDTIPELLYKNKKVASLEVGPTVVKVTYNDSTKEAITTEEANKRGFLPPPPPPPPTYSLLSSFDGLFVLNGKMITKTEINAIDPKNIQSINVLKSNSATLLYGEKGKNGVIEITTKEITIDVTSKNVNGIAIKQNDSTYKAFKGLHIIPNNDSRSVIPEIIADEFIFEKNEFGKSSFKDNIIFIINGEVYAKKNLKDKVISAKKGHAYGPNNKKAIELYGDIAKNGVIVFESATIIDKPSISKNYTKDKITESDQMWNIPVPPNPVIDNNDTVPVPDKVFTKTESEASFPGGNDAWIRYIKNIIQKNIKELSNQGISGTCRVRFIVNIDGRVMNVSALTMGGTILAQISVDAIKNGPKWTPAKQNGYYVASYREQSITFTIQKDITSANTINSGDRIIVKWHDKRDLILIYKITEGGTISSEKLGKINVKGLPFEDAKDLVRNKFGKVLPPQTDFYVSIERTIGNLRTIY